MKKFLILTIAFLGMAMNVFSQNRSINFIEGKTFEEIKALAKKENKMIFMDVYTVWCGPCKLMDIEIFTENKVADLYNQNFICIKIDAEKGEGIYLSKLYQFQAYPTLLFLSSDGSMIHRSCGSHNLNEFIQLGTDALVPKKQISSVLFSLSMKKDERSMFKVINLLEVNCIPTDKAVSDLLAVRKDTNLFSKDNWKMIYQYTSDISSKEFQFVLNNRAKFSSIYGDSIVDKKLSSVYVGEVLNIARDTVNNKENQFQALKEEMVKVGFPQQEKFLVEVDLVFYKTSGYWQKFAELSSEVVGKYFWDNAIKLNQISMVFIDNTDDTLMIQKAIKWVARSIELKDAPGFNNTYAHLLFKLGRVEEAIEAELHAMELAKVLNQENAKDYEAIAKEFEKHLK